MMGVLRIITTLGIAAALPGAVQPALAAPDEGLVVTKMADPDPYFVPTKAGRPGRAAVHSDDNPTLSEAMEQFGRAIGQAAMIQQQNMEAKCRSMANGSMSDAERLAWAASCSYSRR